MNDRTCRTCLFWDRYPGQAPEALTRCLRHAPAIGTAYTTATDRCGEYQQNEPDRHGHRDRGPDQP
jgi:hypothetical protein